MGDGPTEIALLDLPAVPPQERSNLPQTAAIRRGTWRRGLCPDEEMGRADDALGAERALHGAGGLMSEWNALYDACDRAAQALAVVVSALERSGSPALYRRALEAHAYASMLRAELRAQLRAAAQAAATPQEQAP